MVSGIIRLSMDASGRRCRHPLGGRHTRMVAGCGAILMDGPGFLTNRGAGLHITTDDGYSSDSAGAGRRADTGFTRLRWSVSSLTETECILGGYRWVHVTRFIRGGTSDM